MSLRSDIPKALNFTRPEGYQAEPPTSGLGDWAANVLDDAGSDTEISIFEVIGMDWWTGGGWTGARMQESLAKAGGQPITVKINSPGGDVFEGMTIFNELRAYPAKVTVQVVGVAASAASIIAMAADEIVMGLGSTMMVHNAWGCTCGNRHDFTAAANIFAVFDQSLADVYVARTQKTVAEVIDLMDGKDKGGDGTWMTAKQAVEMGFADAFDDTLKAKKAPDTPENRAILAKRKAESALAKAGYTRSDRQALLYDLNASAAQRDASRNPAARDAGIDMAELAEFSAQAASFLKTLQS